MDLLNSIKQFLTTGKRTETPPAEYCPNCWGRQEYEGKFYEAIHNEKIDLNNISQKKGWITAFFKEKFEGIKLKEINGVKECSTCQLSYQ